MSEAGNRRVLRASPEVVRAQSRKYAQVALEHYNQTKKTIKLELVDAMPLNCMREECYFYAHVNFTARPAGEEVEEGSSEDQEQQLFFAELQLCGRRRAPSGFLVTCCEPLGPDKTVGHRGVSPDGSAARDDVDFTRCFACSSRMLHPKGEKYVAGRCYVPYFYTTP